MAQVTTLSADFISDNADDLLEPIRPQARRGAILIVEDRDDVRQGLSQLLELHGYLVWECADAVQSRQHLQADGDGVALMLLDLMLPGTMNGWDLRAWQLAHPALAAIPTIVVSACEPTSGEHALLRPDAWLEKPFRFSDLLPLVRRYVAPEGFSMD